jgi:hypothetical protein
MLSLEGELEAGRMALRKKKEKKTPSLRQLPDAVCFPLSPPHLDPSLHRRTVPASSLDQHGVAAGPLKRGSLRACSYFL